MKKLIVLTKTICLGLPIVAVAPIISCNKTPQFAKNEIVVNNAYISDECGVSCDMEEYSSQQAEQGFTVTFNLTKKPERQATVFWIQAVYNGKTPLVADTDYSVSPKEEFKEQLKVHVNANVATDYLEFIVQASPYHNVPVEVYENGIVSQDISPDPSSLTEDWLINNQKIKLTSTKTFDVEQMKLHILPRPGQQIDLALAKGADKEFTTSTTQDGITITFTQHGILDLVEGYAFRTEKLWIYCKIE